MKISVIMQSYLGDYPNSRKNPEFKFVRAVSSFLAQKYEDRELIIVADGCEQTKQLYETLYSHDARIKFAFVAKNKLRTMYATEKVGDKTIKHYRGICRQVGCALATGDIICYMDSDDIILPDHITNINLVWKDRLDNHVWASNSMRYVHKNSLKIENFENSIKTYVDQPMKLRAYGYDNDDEFYMNLTVPEERVSTATFAMSHRKNIKTQWKDTMLIYDKDNKVIGGDSEDTIFFMDLMLEGKGYKFESPTYVVCHYRFNLWDI